MDSEEMRIVLNEVLNERTRVDEKTHRLHHQWIEQQIECQRRRRAMVDGMVKQVLGWGTIAALVAIGYAVLDAIKSSLRG